MKPAEARPEDRALQDDMRWLASLLGRVIQRLQGEAVFRAVEELRVPARDAVEGDPGNVRATGNRAADGGSAGTHGRIFR